MTITMNNTKRSNGLAANIARVQGKTNEKKSGGWAANIARVQRENAEGKHGKQLSIYDIIEDPDAVKVEPEFVADEDVIVLNKAREKDAQVEKYEVAIKAATLIILVASMTVEAMRIVQGIKELKK